MGTHPIFESDFDCLTDSKMGEDNSIDSDSSDSSAEAPSGGQFNRKLDKVLSKTVFDKTRRQSLFRRPSLKAKEDDDEPIPDRRRSQAARRSTVGGPQLADLAELQKRLSQSAPKEENSRKKIESVSDGNKRVAVMDTEQKDLEKIMSLQYTINFDVVFATDYTHRTATLSSIDMMKQEIEDQYAKKRLSDLTVAQSEETVEEEQKSVFVELRRQKLLEDVWNKQHPIEGKYSTMMDEKSSYWLECAENHLSNSDPKSALVALEKYSYYLPNQSRVYILKSVAFQQLKDLRMATISIKMAQELGLTPEEQKKLELRLAQIEFKQAEKLNSNGDYSKAIHRYKLASEIIHNFQDSLVKIIKLWFELGENDTAMQLLDIQIDEQPDRLELRIWRTRQLIEMNKLDICHSHLEKIGSIDPSNEELLKMKAELELRGEKHEKNCIMMMAANHLKDALQQVELAIGARPKYLKLFLLRAKIYRRLKLWEDALENIELIRGSGDPIVEQESKELVISIFNDFGVDCIYGGFYKEAIKLFSAAIHHVKTERKIYLNRGDCHLRLGNLSAALSDYEVALNASFHESTCRLIRGRISVVYHEYGTRTYQNGNYEQADMFFSKAIQYQVAPLYLIHRSRVRIMIGNIFLAKADAIAAYEMEPNNSDLVPVLARLFPHDSIPIVDKYKNRFFPVEADKRSGDKNKNHKKLSELNKSKNEAKTKELVSFGEIRSRLMDKNIPKLPSLTSNININQPKKGWKQFNVGINS